MRDLEGGLKAYLKRKDADPRAYALNYRNALLFLALDAPDGPIVPFGWALRALESNWQESRGSKRQVRSVAAAEGLVEVKFGDPLYTSLWRNALNECEEFTKLHLHASQVGFSRPHETKERQKITSFFLLSADDRPALSPLQLEAQPKYEGAEKQVTTNVYQRDPELRRAAVLFAKSKSNGRLPCACCDVDFGERYGEVGDDFIHIHHVNPLGNKQERHLVDPGKDLVAVCPNCHAMIHRGREILTVDQVRKLLFFSGYLKDRS